MKRSIIFALTAICVLTGIISCETYKVAEPEMTAVSEFDGKWVCFGIDEVGDTAVYFIEITNDTYNSSDKIWLTIVNNDPSVANSYAYLDAIRFKANCNNGNLTFNCDSTETTAPYLVWNPYYEMTYYSIGYGMTGIKNYVMGKAVVKDGKIAKDAVATGGNLKASAIEFTLVRADDGEPEATIKMKGMKITGWYDDMAEYVDFMYDNY